MHISTTATTVGMDVTSGVANYLSDNGATYYLHCVVKEATPEPTISATLGTSLSTGTSPDNAFPDVDPGTAASLSAITKTEYFTITTSASHCDQTLTCSGTNNADTLLGGTPDDNDLAGPVVKVLGM